MLLRYFFKIANRKIEHLSLKPHCKVFLQEKNITSLIHQAWLNTHFTGVSQSAELLELDRTVRSSKELFDKLIYNLLSLLLCSANSNNKVSNNLKNYLSESSGSSFFKSENLFLS